MCGRYSFLVLFSFSVVSLQGSFLKANDHILKVRAQPKTVNFGHPVVIETVHRNESPEPWILDQPDRSLSFSLQYSPTKALNGEPVKPYIFKVTKLQRKGVKEPNGEIVDVVYVRPCPKVHLDSNGGTFKFSVDLFSGRKYSHLTPGRWQVAASNGAEKLMAEPIEFDLVFSEESVDFFLERAADDQTDRLTREWAREWLRKVKPDLPAEEVRPYPWAEAAEVAKKYAESMKPVREFAIWWKKHRSTDAVRAAIDQVNHAHGLDPVQVRQALTELNAQSSTKPLKSYSSSEQESKR